MKKFFILVLAMLILVSLASCNVQIIDTTYHFDKAIIFLPSGDTIEGKVESWANYENSDMTQVKIDGKVYLTHSSNVILISE